MLYKFNADSYSHLHNVNGCLIDTPVLEYEEVRIYNFHDRKHSNKRTLVKGIQ